MLAPGLIGWIARFLRPPSPEQSAVRGDPAIHGVETAESDIWMDVHDLVGHTQMPGITRVGKTRFAEVLLTLSLLILAMALTWRARAALFKGVTMGAFGVFVPGRAAWLAAAGTVRAN